MIDLAEQTRYQAIYADPDRWPGYGGSVHGRLAGPLVAGAESVVDVGCGDNRFLRFFAPGGARAVGVDFASPAADVVACATSLPFGSKEFEVLTCFDCLEHLKPEQVPVALREFRRVSCRFVLSIGLEDSKVRGPDGGSLHPCVRPQSWWLEQLERQASHVSWGLHYVTGTWKG